MSGDDGTKTMGPPVTPTVARHGSWVSPISSSLIAEGSVQLDAVSAVGHDVFWLEGRALEKGRQVLVRCRPGAGPPGDVTPADFSVRTRVHEYGGGAYLVSEDAVYFSNFADQRLYRHGLGDEPVPITPAPADDTSVRFADGRLTPDDRWLVCIRERHEDGAVQNEIAAVPTDGAEVPRLLVSGHDFFSSPRVSPDGRRLAWVAWDHPRMPWDGTELWVADLSDDMTLSDAVLVAGGPEESVVQPEWGPDGALVFASDCTGWWNLYRWDPGSVPIPLAPMEAEFSEPAWTFDLSTFAFLADGRIVCKWSVEGMDHLGLLDTYGKELQELEQPYCSVSSLKSAGDGVVFVGATPTEGPAVVRMDVGGNTDVLRRSREFQLDARYVSRPRAVTFAARGSAQAHALYYPPANPGFIAPEGERPPLIVLCHGGPTSASDPAFNLSLQYWTSRGIGVVAVNYGGSSGYGRAYRDRLTGLWGVVDVEDCVNAAVHLVEEGEVDAERLVVRGGSAGGWTALCAVTFHDVFDAASSYFGVADASALAVDTHKFESRYLDGLIGPYPEARDLYEERSPIHHTDRLSSALIIFQGLDDPIVPPNQAEMMVEAVGQKGLPYAYLAFEGEQHGFRRAENIERCLDAELSFYSQLFGFPLPAEAEHLVIHNLRPGVASPRGPGRRRGGSRE